MMLLMEHNIAESLLGQNIGKGGLGVGIAPVYTGLSRWQQNCES
jgi:hypothetical protein